MKKIFLLCSLLILTSGFLKAQDDFYYNDVLYNHALIDVQTAEVLDYYTYNLLGRAFSDGGTSFALNFGVLPRLSLGVAFIAENFIGSSGSTDFLTPAIKAKYRFFDGSEHIPALAIGYDGQGYYYNKDLSKYQQEERGVYLVGSKEVFYPGFNLHLGVNIPDFDDGDVFSFLAMDYTIDNKVTLMTELDNIRSSKTYRFNVGIRLDIGNNFYLDFAVRDLAQNTKSPAGKKLNPERIFQIGYQSSF